MTGDAAAGAGLGSFLRRAAAWVGASAALLAGGLLCRGAERGGLSHRGAVLAGPGWGNDSGFSLGVAVEVK